MALVIHASNVNVTESREEKRARRTRNFVTFGVPRGWKGLKNHFSRRVGSPASGVFQAIYSVFDLNVKVESTTENTGRAGVFRADCNCMYGNADWISTASGSQSEARSLPLAVLIRTVLSVCRTLICNPL